MIIQDPLIKAKCPHCGSENVKSKLSFTNIFAWVGRILGVPTVKIFEKRCGECGNEFQVFRKWGVPARSWWDIEADLNLPKTGSRWPFSCVFDSYMGRFRGIPRCLERFSGVDKAKMPIEIRWWSGWCIIRIDFLFRRLVLEQLCKVFDDSSKNPVPGSRLLTPISN